MNRYLGWIIGIVLMIVLYLALTTLGAAAKGSSFGRGGARGSSSIRSHISSVRQSFAPKNDYRSSSFHPVYYNNYYSNSWWRYYILFKNSIGERKDEIALHKECACCHIKQTDGDECW